MATHRREKYSAAGGKVPCRGRIKTTTRRLDLNTKSMLLTGFQRFIAQSTGSVAAGTVAVVRACPWAISAIVAVELLYGRLALCATLRRPPFALVAAAANINIALAAAGRSGSRRLRGAAGWR